MKFSIIIAVMDGAKTLQATLDSIFCQAYPKWEIVVQDGGSTDGTIAILENCDCRVNWRSEPDTGIYDAWNKALQRVTGDWVIFLGSDDRLAHKHVLARAFNYLARLPGSVDFAFGGLLLDEKKEGQYLAANRSLLAAYYYFLHNMGFPFPATFLRASIFREHAFDASYVIAGDYALTSQLVTRSNVARIPVWVSIMRRGGISDRPETAEQSLQERVRVLRECVAPRADEFVHAIADHVRDSDSSIEDLPED